MTHYKSSTSGETLYPSNSSSVYRTNAVMWLRKWDTHYSPATKIWRILHCIHSVASGRDWRLRCTWSGAEWNTTDGRCLVTIKIEDASAFFQWEVYRREILYLKQTRICYVYQESGTRVVGKVPSFNKDGIASLQFTQLSFRLFILNVSQIRVFTQRVQL